MSEKVRVASGGRSVLVDKGVRYSKSNGKANIWADSETELFYEDRNGESANTTPAIFLRKYLDEGFGSVFGFGS
jgi:hypothetical protein